MPTGSDSLREHRELHQAIELTRFQDAFLLLTNHTVFGQLSRYAFFANLRR
jgi:hypothetical protein